MHVFPYLWPATRFYAKITGQFYTMHLLYWFYAAENAVCRSYSTVSKCSHCTAGLQTLGFTHVSPFSSMVTKGRFWWYSFLYIRGTDTEQETSHKANSGEENFSHRFCQDLNLQLSYCQQYMAIFTWMWNTTKLKMICTWHWVWVQENSSSLNFNFFSSWWTRIGLVGHSCRVQNTAHAVYLQ